MEGGEILVWTYEKIKDNKTFFSYDRGAIEIFFDREVPVDVMPGEFPFLRGPYKTMYIDKPWTVRQYAGFSTVEETNAFFKRNLKIGQTGLSVAFDLPTHRGYDSDNPLVIGDVGKTGVAIDTVEDMKLLFEGIPLNKVSVSMTMNGAVIPVMAFFIVCAEDYGFKMNELSGTIQNDIIKEFMVRNTYIYPPEASMRIVVDVIKFCAEKMPKFNSISISGYHIHEAGATLSQELAFTILDGIEYVKAVMNAGLAIDDFAPRLSFFFAIGKDFYSEIAKLRAARYLWAKYMKRLGAKEARSLMLRTHCQTSGWSLVAQEPLNNIIRTAFECLAAVLGGTQSLHTNSYDEALALPSPTSSLIAIKTQTILQKETDICKVVDPLGGSYLIEALTQKLIKDAEKIIQEIEEEGGMLKAVIKGIPQALIEKAAIERQAKIDTSQEKIVGLNYLIPEYKQPLFELVEIDNIKVVKKQIERIQEVKRKRDEAKVIEALNELEKAAKDKSINLLECAIKAARARATLGEISYALEKVFGRYQPPLRLITEQYKKVVEYSPKFKETLDMVKKITLKQKRPPRILLAKVGQDGHTRGIKVVASAFADAGYDVFLTPLFQSPSAIVNQSIENNVDVISVSTLAGGHIYYATEIVNKLKKFESLFNPIIVFGGTIPSKDIEKLNEIGVHFVFPAGTNLIEAIYIVTQKLSELISKN